MRAPEKRITWLEWMDEVEQICKGINKGGEFSKSNR